ncbi:unnamed protein product [Peniophora sp. CBMAI 1063]|nr:unnamed protein product [Peniophora sp. CBMAI 1063]
MRRFSLTRSRSSPQAGSDHTATLAALDVSSSNSEPSESTATTNLNKLLRAAFDEYHRITGVDITNPNDPLVQAIQSCLNDDTDALLDVLESASRTFRDGRKGNRGPRKLRDALKPILHGLCVLLDASAETASSAGLPGGKGIFAAIGVLLMTAERVGAKLDDMEKVFECLGAYVSQLQVRVKAPLSQQARDLAIHGLVMMLQSLALSTRILCQGRIKMFVKTLLTKSGDVQEALQRLRAHAVDTEMMSIAEITVGVHDLSVASRHVGATLHAVKSIVERIDTTTQALVKRATTNVRGSPEGSCEDTISISSNTYQHRSEASVRPGQVNITVSLPSVDWDKWGRELRCIVLRFSAEDQDVIWKALSLLFLCATESGVPPLNTLTLPPTSVSASVPAYILVHRPARLVENFLLMACTFLLLFMACKLNSITRSLGNPCGTITVVDVFGLSFILSEDTFSSWERTHTFILQMFKDRPFGQLYVKNRDYGLGSSEHPLISPEDWPELVKPGAVYSMSIIMRQSALQCPYCRTSSTGDEMSLSDARIVCSGCSRAYGSYQHLKKAGFLSEIPNSRRTPFSRGRSLAHRDHRELTAEAASQDFPELTAHDDVPGHSHGIFHRIVVELPVKGHGSATPSSSERTQELAGNDATEDKPDVIRAGADTPIIGNTDVTQDGDDDEESAQGDDEDAEYSDLSSELSISDDSVDFDLVYALHTFVATVEGQAHMKKGDHLVLMDDSNDYWWLVRVLKTQEIGYAPAENIETPFGRLARLNKYRNNDLASATYADMQEPLPIQKSHVSPLTKVPVFNINVNTFHYPASQWSDPEGSEDEPDANDEIGRWQTTQERYVHPGDEDTKPKFYYSGGSARVNAMGWEQDAHARQTAAKAARDTLHQRQQPTEPQQRTSLAFSTRTSIPRRTPFVRPADMHEDKTGSEAGDKLRVYVPSPATHTGLLKEADSSAGEGDAEHPEEGAGRDELSLRRKLGKLFGPRSMAKR